MSWYVWLIDDKFFEHIVLHKINFCFILSSWRINIAVGITELAIFLICSDVDERDDGEQQQQQQQRIKVIEKT